MKFLFDNGLEFIGHIMFSDVYKDSRVLVLGHTGFKGSWLTAWLLELGAKVCGISLEPSTNPSLFEITRLENDIDHKVCDVRNSSALEAAIEEFQPDFVFYLAAQAIVSTSYEDPLGTINTNVIGTANCLEALRSLRKKCAAVIITSDKCYENVEWEWGYKETDQLGGKDIYSASKAAAEVVFHGYCRSFFDSDGPVRIATARAGNVLGGGDWSKDRIIVDCVKNWSQGEAVDIRSPSATRPWQHVLEPLSGYLLMGATLYNNKNVHGESFNFGPQSDVPITVGELITDLAESWKGSRFVCAHNVIEKAPFSEAELLKLNCDKALFRLRWQSVLSYQECVDYVGKWYLAFYQESSSMRDMTREQILNYAYLASQRGRDWSN